ncbi:hypothetical protein HanRHA438_Chr11g0486081 [Helianthus annuus]|uniref:Uncharacterized protein n=1 Tax=Helianthus annuus TaxID=4232 RepID=A0A9K3HL96_HELAN|nr:QWRF motif-containing protein 2-like [Helianthus annuus]KAF5780496.1 hypothetical protein HanXRQr2_Chr11g0472541 [Helianthus annuus]KAJ0507700.1 hypothetical protein HanIR_Chr11g0509101 [Helianthus annuus]KAJ0869159.1 hypothetical protein HanRHA438_Chr11g0486081 [Helianthus annuus]
MVANASSRLPSPSKPKRSPLSPSDADNNGYSLPRGPKYREVSSRYLSSTTMTSSSSSSSSLSVSSTTTTSSSNSICTPMRRFPSPLVSSTTNSKRAQSAERRRIATPLVSSTNLMTPAVEMSSKRVQSAERRRIVTPLVSSTNLMTSASTENSKRAQSAERRRIVTPRIGEMMAGEKMLTKTPVRSLSVLFQGNSVACPASKVLLKSYSGGSNNNNRLGTPERKAATPVKKLGDSKPIDQQRWPGRLKKKGNCTVPLTAEGISLPSSPPDKDPWR